MKLIKRLINYLKAPIRLADDLNKYPSEAAPMVGKELKEFNSKYNEN